MPIGILTNCIVVLLGGLAGWLAGKYVPEHIRETLPLIFGLSAMSIGIVSIIKVQALPVVVLSIIIGTTIGEAFRLENKIIVFFSWILSKLPMAGKGMDMERYITVVALFCVSGLGIFGALTEGMSGDASILLSKSVLDFFTAVIFAATLGIAVSFIAFPQFVILLLLFAFSKSILPLVSTSMLADFTACGGILTLAAGLRIARIKSIPIMSMIPSLVLVMPISYLWSVLYTTQ